MKCVRELEQGVMLNTFGVKDKYYFSVAVMTYFSLDNPDEPLKESEMWPMVQEEIGKETVFDMGLPKQRGEVVVCGKCYTPGGKPAPACPVGVRVGSVAKELHVFGPRFWDSTPAGPVPTSPTPFTMLDLTWEKAFGGPGFPQNPLGKGHDPIVTDSGGKVVPLPNVEYSNHPVTSPSDRPAPAGFMPIDLMWPQRHSKTGTYDDKWFRERWPYYPEDMDWTFFNVTPEDQWAKDFFSGEEDIELTNMHPRHPRLLSRLPRLRQRIFIHRLKDWRDRDGEYDFVEQETRVDTVWLFPHRERGVTFSRTVFEIHDDEPLDVKYLFLVTEPMDEAPKSLQHYKEELERKLDRSIKIDLAPLEEAQEKIKDAVDQLKDLPKIIEDKVDEGLGKAPMVKKSPAQVAKEAHAALDVGMSNMDMAEKQLTEVKAKFGHMAKVDLKAVVKGREKMAKAKEDISAAVARVEKMKSDTAAKAADMRKKMEAELEYTKAAAKGAQKDDEAVKLAADSLAGFDAAMDMALDRVPGDPWKTRGFDFVVRCRQRLIDEDPDAFKTMRRLGFRPYTLKRSFLGINPVEAVHSRAQWGLEPDEKAKAEGRDPDELIIPAGLVIPRFQQADLMDICLLPGEWAGKIGSPEPWHRVDGSEEGALACAVQPHKPVLILPDALQARLVEQEADDMVGVLAMKTPGDTLDDDTAAMVPEASHVYVAHPEDKPLDLDPWTALHETPEPAPFPYGPDLFTARKQGLDIRKWVRGLLPAELVADIPEDEELDDDGFSDLVPKPPVPPKHDIKGLVERLQKKIQDHVQPLVDKAQQERKAVLTEAAETLKKYNKDPQPMLDLLAKDPLKMSFANEKGAAVKDMAKEFSEAMADNRKRIVDAGKITPELEKQLSEYEGKFSKLFADAGALQKDAEAQMAELGGKGKLPAWAQEQLKKAGWEPDDPMQFTRQDVIDRYAAGRTLAQKNLQGLDLSGLDLSGANLKNAILVGTNFSGSNLSGADMEQCVAEKVDFTKANLQNVRLRRSICKKAKFVQADLSGAIVTQAMLVGADLSKARCVGTDITETLFEKAICQDANFTQAHAVSSYFIEADVSRADFGQAEMERCVFMKATLDNTRFVEAKARQLYILESQGQEPIFAGADMHNSRIINDTNLVDADFTDIACESGAWFRSKLPGADFRGAHFYRSMLEQCEIPGANLRRVQARHTRFNHTDMTNADMQGMNLYEGSLRKAWVTNADMRHANLYGAEFFKTKIGQTRLEGANLKKTYLRDHMDIVRDINDPARRSNAVDFQPDQSQSAKDAGDVKGDKQ